MNIIRFIKDAATLYREAKLRQKAAPSGLQSVSSYSWNSWYGPIRESFAGAWQRNIEIDSQTSILAFSAVFSCVTGIAADIAKLRIKLDKEHEGIWEELTDSHGNASITPILKLLRKPNRYQNRIQFVTCWIVSKLLYGNAYILKERERGVVVAMYVLDPAKVTVLVATDGSVYYQLSADYLAGLSDDDPRMADGKPTIPASEIIHDRMVTLWHPLVGVSPIYACGASATMGNRIQSNSTTFFQNLSRPGGQLTAPGPIGKETAERLKEYFETNFSGANIGRLFVGGDGLKYEGFLTIPAEAAQLIEQLKWTVEDVGRAFHYPAWKLGGAMPQYAAGPEAVVMMYYTDCLQSLIESMELCLDEGLELPASYCTELDLDNLMRMDTKALFESNNLGVSGGWLSPDEARYRANLPSVPGGDSPMIQQQNYSLAALSKRDAQADPFASAKPVPAPASPTPTPPMPETPQPKAADLETLEALIDFRLRKELSLA